MMFLQRPGAPTVHDYPTSDVNVSSALQSVVLLAGRDFPVDGTAIRTRRAAGDVADAMQTEQPDILVLTAASVTPELAQLLQAPRHDHIRVILEAGEADADLAGLLLDTNLTILDAPASAEQLAKAIADAIRNVRAGDTTSGFSANDRIAALTRDAERVASALAELAAGQPGATVRPVDPSRIRAHIKARRIRDRFFAPDLFADPAWDMLLDLAAARLEGRRVSVSSLCIAAAVPTTTALRWIKTLVDGGIFLRDSDPADARRAFIGMTPATATAMEGCLEAVLNLPGQ